MILLAQNSSQLSLSCHHFVMHYTGNPWQSHEGSWLENQMSASQPLDFLHTWYHDSADAEFKPASAVLPSLRDALYGNPWQSHEGSWLENQMSASQPLDFLHTWHNVDTTVGMRESVNRDILWEAMEWTE